MEPETADLPDGREDLRPLIPILFLVLGGISTGFVLFLIVVARLFAGQP